MKSFSLPTLRKQRVAIDFGSSLLKVLGGVRRRAGISTKFAEFIDLLTEYKISASDEVTDELYIDSLKKVVWRYNLKSAAVSLPANEAIMQTMRFSTGISHEKMLEAIEDEIAANTFEDIDDLQIACCELDSAENSGNSFSILACAMPRELIARYKNILHQAGLQPTLFDLDILGIYNCFYWAKGKNLQAPAILLHCGAEYSYCVIMQKNAQPFFRILNAGGNHIVTRLMEETGFGLAQAEGFKRKFLSDVMKYDTSVENLSIVEIYCEFAAQLIGEIRRCLQHYQVAEGVTEFDSIYLTGGDARNVLLANLLNHGLNIPAQVWDPLQQREYRLRKPLPYSDKKIGLHLSSAIGAMMHEG